MQLETKAVRSSLITKVHFNETTSTMFIDFTTGGQYSYTPATRFLYDSLTQAPSVGKYFLTYIQYNPHYTCTKLY